jgi:hypothetical protein
MRFKLVELLRVSFGFPEFADNTRLATQTLPQTGHMGVVVLQPIIGAPGNITGFVAGIYDIVNIMNNALNETYEND